MPASPKKNRKVDTDAGLRLVRRLVRAAAVIFGVAGLVMLYGARDYIPPLAQPDPVLGVSTRALLCVAGLAHLAVCAWLCVTRDPISLGLVACWAALNYGVYLAGAALLRTAEGPIPAAVVFAWELGVSAKVIYTAWGVFTAYLALSGLALVMRERRRRLRLEAEVFLKDWHASHDGRPYSANCEQLGRTAPTPVTSRAPEKITSSDFKFSCPLCAQHIRCESAYAGRRIACPACREEIRVPDLNREASSPTSSLPNH